MDWGLAKILASGERQPPVPEPTESQPEATEIRTQREPDSATQAGSVLGTPAYMAPEQAAGEIEEVDERADVFGLGAMLCVILTGKPPYSGPSTDAIRVKAIRGETADALVRLDACGADAELVALCKRCLATDRDTRPRDAGAVAKTVAAHLAAVEKRARQAELDHVRAEGERARAEAEERERRKRRRVQLALVGALMGLLTITGCGALSLALWQRAERAKEAAESARSNEVGVRVVAELARREAEAARDSEKRLREQFEASDYGRTTQLAHQAWRDSNVALALALLDGKRADLRGWEWHYVHRLCHSDLLTLRAHAAFVRSAAFSPDGKRVLAVSSANDLCVWDAKTGAEQLRLRGGTDRASQIARAFWNADGSRILAEPFSAEALWVWDAKAGSAVAVPNERVADPLVSADGDRVVDLRPDHPGESVWILNARTRAKFVELKGHASGIQSASWSPDGTRVATGSADKTAKVWDAKTGAELLTLRGHTDTVNDVAWDRDGSRLVTAGSDQTVRVWDAKTNFEFLALDSEHKGRTFTGTQRDPFIKWAGASGPVAAVPSRVVGREPNARSGVARVASRTNRPRTAVDTVVTAPFEWFPLTFAGVFGEVGNGEVSSAAWSPDGSRVVLGSESAEVWDAVVGRRVRTFGEHPGRLTAVAWSFDGSRIASASADSRNTLKVWSAKTGAQLHALKGHASSIEQLAWNPRALQLVAVSGEKTAKVWDAGTGVELLTLRDEGGIVSVSWSSDGTRIATGSSDETIRVWDAKTGTELSAFRTRADSLEAVAWNPTGAQIATGGRDGSVRIWDARSGAEVLTLRGHTGRITSISWSPDGSRLVSSSADNTARIWDTTTGADVLTLRGHAARVNSTAWSPDGSRIVTSSDDKTARVWDARPVNRDVLPRGSPRVEG